MSLFILSGNLLQGRVKLEGPIGPIIDDDQSSSTTTTMDELYDTINNFDNNNNNGDNEKIMVFQNLVDFEHLRYDDDDDDDQYYDDDDSDDDEEEEEEIPPIVIPTKKLTREEMMETYENAQRRKALIDKRKQREEKANKKKKKIMKKLSQQQGRQKRQNQTIERDGNGGEPYLSTVEVSQDGWYRVCVEAKYETIVVEMEMRKESELGLARDGQHVMSYEDKLLFEEEESFNREYDNDMKKEEEKGRRSAATGSRIMMVHDDDFDTIREKVQELRSSIAEIQSLQLKERRRVIQHSETNKHSHTRMVKASILETILFVSITGYQIYLIRTWFSTGSPVLGR